MLLIRTGLLTLLLYLDYLLPRITYYPVSQLTKMLMLKYVCAGGQVNQAAVTFLCLSRIPVPIVFDVGDKYVHLFNPWSPGGSSMVQKMDITSPITIF